MGSTEKQQNFCEEKNKDSLGKRGDTLLHVAIRAGNLGQVKVFLQNSGDNWFKEFISTQNQDGETALYVAAEINQILVVTELLKHLDIESAATRAKNGYDAFHIAAKLGHLEVLRELLQPFPQLAMTTDASNSTALYTAATQGHINVVNFLLETDSSLTKIARRNGKTALHSAARMGHHEVVKSLLIKDPSMSFTADKKGQTALHMAVKGQRVEVVLEFLKPEPSTIGLVDNKGNTALHIAVIKSRTQILETLLLREAINVNAINKVGETPLDIAEKIKNEELISILKRAGAVTSKELANPPTPSSAKQLKQTVSDIRHEVQSQLPTIRQTGIHVEKIAKKLKKMHISGLNNAINSATVVAVLIATVAFAAIFTVPGQYVEKNVDGFTLGEAHVANGAAFMVFFVFDATALFISLAVVVVQTSIVVVEQKAKKQVVFVINKLMWMACLFISVAFIALSYVVVGIHELWLAIFATVVGSLIMLTTLGSLCYCIIVHRFGDSNKRNIRRKSESRSFFGTMSMPSDAELLDTEYKKMYAL